VLPARKGRTIVPGKGARKTTAGCVDGRKAFGCARPETEGKAVGRRKRQQVAAPAFRKALHKKTRRPDGYRVSREISLLVATAILKGAI